MTPSPLIDRARAVPLEDIIEAHGIKLRGRIERIGPCPVCGGTDRFAMNTRKQLFNCRRCGTGGDVISLVQFLDDYTFREAVETLARSPRETRQRLSISGRPYIIAGGAEAAPCPSDARRDLASAARIASRIAPLIGTLGAAYLRDVRKIDVTAIEDVLSRTDAVGWHSGVYFNEPCHALHGQKLGCIVGVMTAPKTAKPTGAISRTYLDGDGRKIGKAKTLGSPAGAVRLSPDEDVTNGLFLAEGLETALAAMSIGLRPIWATGSTALMGSFPPLSGIDTITILADHDANGAGEDAARELEKRWRRAGCEVRILRSERLGDFNDVLKGEVE